VVFMLSFCLRVLNMSHDFIINYSIFGKAWTARIITGDHAQASDCEDRYQQLLYERLVD